MRPSPAPPVTVTEASSPLTDVEARLVFQGLHLLGLFRRHSLWPVEQPEEGDPAQVASGASVKSNPIRYQGVKPGELTLPTFEEVGSLVTKLQRRRLALL